MSAAAPAPRWTEMPAELRSVIRSLQHAARRDASLRAALLAGAGLAWYTVALLLAERFTALPLAPLVAGGAAGAALAGLVLVLRTPRTAELVARIADRRLGLDERLATAVALGATAMDGDVRVRQLSDAARVATAVRPHSAFPLHRHVRVAAFAAAAVAAVAALGLTLPSSAPAASRAGADRSTITRAAGQIGDLAHQAQHNATQESQPAGPDHQLAQVLQQGTARLRQAQTPQQALEELSRLSQELKGLEDPSLPGKVNAAAAAGSALAAGGAPTGLASALANGDLGAAAQQVSSLAAALPSMTPVQQSQLATALGSAAAAAGADPALASRLGAAAAALNRGDTPAAQQALQQASGELGSLAQAQAAAGDLAGAEQQVDATKGQVAAQADADAQGSNGNAGSNAGSGSGSGSNGGAGSGSGSGSQPGSGAGSRSGTGSGSQSGAGSGSGGSGGSGGQGSAGSGGRSSSPAAGGDRLFIPGGTGDPLGQQTGAQFGAGLPVPQVDYEQVLQQFDRLVLETLGRSAFASSDRDLIREYFSALQDVAG